MAAKLVSYDLKDADTWEYQILYDELNFLKGAKIQESVWAIPFDGNSESLAKELAPYVREDDRLYILDYPSSDRFGHNLIDGDAVREINGGISRDPDRFDWGSKLKRK